MRFNLDLMSVFADKEKKFMSLAFERSPLGSLLAVSIPLENVEKAMRVAVDVAPQLYLFRVNHPLSEDERSRVSSAAQEVFGVTPCFGYHNRTFWITV